MDWWVLAVIWDSGGIVVVFSYGYFNGAYTTFHAELMALREGLILASNCSLSIDIADSDALNEAVVVVIFSVRQIW
ncbi:hypothetical protein TorRG33x02_006380 [Trema orientale]|uniref:RNase H type-1 domain-containing protein n=1 Tax=Trema orientale TaxID=63057 RepID=A0A2P5G048_TREOI|nr:hypothetical protein TorRG33x02_006380 [Trema orientale]